MSTDDINNQTGTAGESAGEATTNLILDASLFPKIALPVPARFDPIVCFGIKTVHGECGGVIDDDGDTLKCRKPTTLSALVSVLQLGTSLKTSSWTSRHEADTEQIAVPASSTTTTCLP